MTATIRRFLGFEGITFLIAALIHAGVLLNGYEHREAMIAESVIGAVLLVALGLTWVWPQQARLIGISAQAFALLGTLVGVFTIVIGIGPRTVPDIVYHLAIVGVLVWGLVVAVQGPRPQEQAAAPQGR